ncbi:3',5'-cyclic AMP phosphodiesterase CpdA [Rhizobium petrolearium]|uniref:metallophosphoesterase n=1 Tax=Neorhizobium petrolearium TaxID=515361 RepID=UPI001AEAB234|nr:metallophosphoesterase [Neorhizobium petrolearium]MBP1843876.1 3',5'-cyclic AMP phosphodiesterase CpdA [Neorhizobium petrolearium]
MPHETPLLRFGVIADPQYADLPPWLEMDRYYANSLDKLREAIGVLNGEDLSFVVTLGDLVDRNWESYDPVLSVYEGLRHESFLMPGNHDFAVAPERLDDVHGRLGMPAAWHDFSRGGFRFIVIDGNEISLFSAPEGHPRHTRARERLETLLTEGAINAKEWNGGIGEEQFAWLEETLTRSRAAGEQVIVMGHYPLFPENEHNLWGHGSLTDLFARSGNVVAYLNGHNHAGNLGRNGNTWYVNFKGMVDTEKENTFAVVEIFPDRIAIIGHGREESRTLPL